MRIVVMYTDGTVREFRTWADAARSVPTNANAMRRMACGEGRGVEGVHSVESIAPPIRFVTIAEDGTERGFESADALADAYGVGRCRVYQALRLYTRAARGPLAGLLVRKLTRPEGDGMSMHAPQGSGPTSYDVSTPPEAASPGRSRAEIQAEEERAQAAHAARVAADKKKRPRKGAGVVVTFVTFVGDDHDGQYLTFDRHFPTATAAAECIGVSRQTIQALADGHRTLPAERTGLYQFVQAVRRDRTGRT